MADQKITELPIKTSTGINLTDYLLGIDSAEGYQMLVSDIAKKIVEDYAGSTLLGVAQSVADAFGKTYNLGIATSIPNSADLNVYTDAGTFKTDANATADTLSNCPVTGITFKMTVEKIYSGNGIIQSLIAFNNPPRHFERRGLYSSNAWAFSEWLQVPTRAEINNLQSATKSFLASETFQINKNNSVTFDVPRNSEYFVILNGIDSGMRGVYFIASSSSSSNWTVEITTVYESSSPLITFNTATAKKLTVSNAHTTLNARMTVINTNGSMMGIQTAGTNSAQSESI